MAVPRVFVAALLLSIAGAVAIGRSLPRRVATAAVATAVINLAFLPTLFVRHGAFQPGGFLAHTTATLVLELWVLDADLVLAVGRRGRRVSSGIT